MADGRTQKERKKAKGKGNYLDTISYLHETGGNSMELKEALEKVEVKNYKNGKPCNILKLLEKADAGSVKAMKDFVETVYYNKLGEDDPEDVIAKRQVHFMKKLSKIKAYKYMCIFVGDAYERGRGVHKDINKTIKWYKKAARGGVKFGNECIGMLYFNGDAVPTDYEKAYKYFTKDSGKKSFNTTYALGEMFRNGWYLEKDLDLAYRCYSDIVYIKTMYDKNGNNINEMDDYYWRACYRVARAEHYGEGTKIHLGSALEKLHEAMMLYEERNEEAKDITWEEIIKEWKKLNKDAGWT